MYGLEGKSWLDKVQDKLGPRGILAVIIVAALIALWFILSGGTTKIERAVKDCSLATVEPGGTHTGDYAMVNDSGKTLSVRIKDGKGQVTASALRCTFNKIGARDSMLERIGNTRVIDGQQHEGWDGFTATWSIFLNDGASIIIEEH